jgi:hypothetical protein
MTWHLQDADDEFANVQVGAGINGGEGAMGVFGGGGKKVCLKGE